MSNALAIGGFAAAVVAGTLAVSMEKPRERPRAVAEMKGLEGQPMGQVQLEEGPRGVWVRVKLTGLPPGERAFHIPEVGLCEPPFKSAGGHFNPTKKKHGFLHPQGQHRGDLPNLKVTESGTVELEHFVEGVSLGKGAGSLFDRDGSAFIVHAGPDD